jgi:hypothetical protein
LFDAFAATLNWTAPVSAGGAVHSIVQVLAPGVAARDPI